VSIFIKNVPFHIDCVVVRVMSFPNHYWSNAIFPVGGVIDPVFMRALVRIYSSVRAFLQFYRFSVDNSDLVLLKCFRLGNLFQ
jgi:hypothetical protein